MSNSNSNESLLTTVEAVLVFENGRSGVYRFTASRSSFLKNSIEVKTKRKGSFLPIFLPRDSRTIYPTSSNDSEHDLALSGIRKIYSNEEERVGSRIREVVTTREW